ncbi:MAG: Amidohydro-rel protein [Actinomycetota bacterium]|nr:Amidohydro-rel protein [Actinomycetota bacterium]
MIRLPGLVDLHVHLRDPGQTHKEDFLTGTSAALAGGFTTVLDMPNNAVPVTTARTLSDKIETARRRIVCDTGLYLGSLGEDLSPLAELHDRVWGLKLYLNATTGSCLMDATRLARVFSAWPEGRPILLHAEADVIDTVVQACRSTGRAVHVCHVSSRAELEPVLEAKAEGLPVTCGVTPHHLFLTDEDATGMGPVGEVRPCLKSAADQYFLWENLHDIDVVESDHAPHTPEEKQRGTFGFPGLETTLPLLLQAEREGRLDLDAVVEKCALTPRRIAHLPEQPDTWVDVEPVEFTITAESMQSRAAWTPFAGRTGFGRVHEVTLRGEVVYRDGKVLARPGSGRLLTPTGAR